MGRAMHHGPRLWSKNCAVTRTEKCCKKLHNKLQKERHIHRGRGGEGGWGGVPTLVSLCGWEGQRIHGKVTVGR